jgi:GNAT superfamily N-acetyltransferase
LPGCGCRYHVRMPEVEVRLLAAGGADLDVMAQLAELVNRSYAASEKGMWLDGAARTTPEDVAEMARGRKVAVARLGGRIVGCIRIEGVDERAAEFGMLAADLDHRGVGIGRELVLFAEGRSRDAGFATMRLELLVPREWAHPSKEFLAAWYTRMGYRSFRRRTVEESYPELAPWLATPCDFVTYRKNLGE